MAEMEKLKKENKELKSQILIPQTHNNIQNNIQNIHKSVNNNIQINDFGKPNVEYLSDTYLRGCMKTPRAGTIDIVKRLFYNKTHPENHSLRWDNIKKPIMRIKEMGKWIHRNKDDVMYDALENGYTIMDMLKQDDMRNIQEPYYKNREYLNDQERNAYDKFSYLFDNRDNELIKFLQNELLLLVMNERKNVNM